MTHATTLPMAPRRHIAAVSIGNGLEVYDFVVYSFFAVLIGQQFFPAADPVASLLLSFVVFGAGFVMRPFGALVIGRYADRHGRIAALNLTIWLMGLGTLLFVITPTYQQIGVTASWLLLLGRLLQGFSMGGEIGAASVYLLEAGAPGNACRRVSWQFASQGAGSAAGALVAVGLGALLPPEATGWSWRLAFALGLLIVPVGIMIRRRLQDTAWQRQEASTGSYRELWALHRPDLWWGTLLITGATASVYLMLNFLPSFLPSQLQWPKQIGQLAALAGGFTVFLVSPLIGRLADHYQWRRTLLWPAIMLALVLVVPMFWLILNEAIRWLLIPLVMIFMVLTSAMSVVGMTLLMEAFPPHIRARALAIIYSMGVTLFGGFSAAIVLKLISVTGSNWMPMIYLVLALAVSLLAAMRFNRKPRA